MSHFPRRTVQGLVLSLLLLASLPAASRQTRSHIPLDVLRARIAQLDHREFDKPGEAQAFELKKRVPVGAHSLPVERYFTALEHMRGMAQHSTLRNAMVASRQEAAGRGLTASLAREASTSWVALGPGNIGGRTRALLIDPTAPRTLYAAAVAGGVWKSVDAGKSWTPLTDFLSNIAVNSLVMDPANSQVLFAGTGEGYFNIDSLRGGGVFTTGDGGATWSQVPGTSGPDFFFVNHMEISAASGNLYAATGTGVWSLDRTSGQWTQIYTAPATQIGGCLDLKMRVDGANDVVFASCGTFVQATVYQNKMAQAGGSWTPVLSVPEQGRTSLAIAPSNPQVIYAMAARNDNGPRREYNQGLLGVFRSTQGGDAGTWTTQVFDNDKQRLNTRLLSNAVIATLQQCGFGGPNGFDSQGWYDNVIAVDPVNSDRVWAGGIDLYRSDDGGKNWGLASYWWAQGQAPSYAHADHHAITFHPHYDGVANQVMYDGSDGGIFRTTNAVAAVAHSKTATCDPGQTAITWANLNNGYAATQFYDGAVFPGGTTYFAGAQDNGTSLGADSFGPNNWFTILGGDGGFVAVNPTNPKILYAENTGLSIACSSDGAQTFFGCTRGILDFGDFLFITPFTMDPLNPSRLWVGGAFLWRTDDGAKSWTRSSRLIAGPFGSSVSAIGVSPSNSDHVLVGTDVGFIMYNDKATKSNGKTFWPSSFPQNAYVSWVAVDPNHDNVAYATYSNFGVTHVWRSVDGGGSWQGIDGSGTTGLPDVPAHTVVVDPADSNRLYVGTDLGVFTSPDAGQTWAVELTGFPNTAVTALVLQTNNGVRTLYAFTHGRGAWKADLQ